MNLPFSGSGSGKGDPASAYDARPIVAIRRKDQSAWWFAGGALIAALLLFMALEARRQGVEEAEVGRAISYSQPSDTVPELVVPALPAEPLPYVTREAVVPAEASEVGPRISPVPRVAPPPHVAPQPGPSPFEYPASPPPPPMAGEPGYAPPQSEHASPPAAAGTNGRVMAGRLQNPSTTVIQGTLINAVLETALDSTRPGQARAVVTRDVYGFDGKQLLIPRGSHLYGSYEADIAQGQNRAQILWTRLLRPDGVSVALDSPAADPLGRAGVKGKVNSHFIQRLGNALLGTAGNIGSALVTRHLATSPVVVAVPGAAQAVQPGPQIGSREIMPTLTVKQGTRISVFVQHDLDFTSVEAAP